MYSEGVNNACVCVCVCVCVCGCVCGRKAGSLCEMICVSNQWAVFEYKCASLGRVLPTWCFV